MFGWMFGPTEISGCLHGLEVIDEACVGVLFTHDRL